MYGLLTPREPVNEKLGWLDNPKNMGLLHAALGILANNSGHYGALAPALGTGGLLGLQAAMGTQQQNVQNRRNNRIDARRDYFSREEMDLRKKEFGLKEADIANEYRASSLIGTLGGGETGSAVSFQPQPAQQLFQSPPSKFPTDFAAAQTQVQAPPTEVNGGAPWEAVDASIVALDDLAKQDQGFARSKAYTSAREKLAKDRDFLSKQREVKPLPGAEGYFYQEGKDGFFEFVDNGMGGTKRRYATSAELKKLGVEKATNDKRPTIANQLRQDFLTVSKSFKDVKEGYARIVESAKSPSAAGDLSMIFSYMKILDPTSVVREGEQATAANARGVPEAVKSWYNRVLSGEKLSEDQRADFLNRAGMLYKTAESQQEQIESQFEAMAKRHMINPDDVVVRYRANKSNVIHYDAQGNRVAK